MNHDYKDFLAASKKTPTALKQEVRSLILKELDPSHKLIFGKLILVHGVIGLMTMLFCPQFNLSLTNSYDLFHFLHRTFGHEICMIICGSIFLGSGALVAISILSEIEIQKIKNSQFLYYVALSILMVSTFMVLGAEIYLNLVTFWILGSVLGSLILFNIGNLVKKKLAKI